jgi:hypothetical protein
MNEIIPANGALMSFIERAAKDETFDVAKFETLLRVRRDEAHDQSRRAFNAAMASCQSEMEPVLRDSTNPGVRSKYAKLEAIDQQMRPIYTRHGFSVRFGSAPPPQPGWMRITCTVAHDAGYFEENYLDSPVTTQGSQGGRIAMTPVQAVGSVVTYLRRYLLGMVFNIVLADMAGEDDDGEGSRRAVATTTSRAPVKRAPVDANDAYQAPPPPTVSIDLSPLLEDHGPTWLKNLETLLMVTATDQEEILAIGGHFRVSNTLADKRAPVDVKRRVTELLANGYKRFAEPADDGTEAHEPETEGVA